jgi:hypothetical protein
MQASRLIPLVIETKQKLNAGRYINTTTNKAWINCAMQKILIEGVIHLIITTIREI